MIGRGHARRRLSLWAKVHPLAVLYFTVCVIGWTIVLGVTR